MRESLLFKLVALVAIVAAPVLVEGGTEQGDQEVALMGNIVNIPEQNEQDSSTNAMIMLRYGYMLTKAWEVNATLGVMIRESKEYDVGDTGEVEETSSEITTDWILGVETRYHLWTEKTWVPYLGAGASVYVPGEEGADTAGQFTGIVGVRFFVSEKTNVFIEYQPTVRTDSGGEDGSDNLFMNIVVFGVSVFF